MTPSAPDSALACAASSMETMSPFTTTGSFTDSFTWRTKAQSAEPLYIWQRVRPCTVIIWMPQSSAIFARFGALRLS